MQVLKKEISKTSAEEGEKNAEYRTMLITAIHKSATNFPDAVSTVVPILVGFLGDSNQSSAVDVILFIREIMETYPHLREAIVEKLLEALPTIQSSRVARVALWLVGEYCVDATEVARAMTVVRACLGELPFSAQDDGAEGRSAATDSQCCSATGASASAVSGAVRPLVLADGTYAAQSALEETAAAAGVACGVDGGGSSTGSARQKLRLLLVGGDFFLATVVATTLTKLALRTRLHAAPPTANLVAADVVLMLSGLLRLGAPHTKCMPPGTQPQQMDLDSQERISMYLQVRLLPHRIGREA